MDNTNPTQGNQGGDTSQPSEMVPRTGPTEGTGTDTGSLLGDKKRSSRKHEPGMGENETIKPEDVADSERK